MPVTAQPPGREDDRNRTAPWITLASMFAGQRLDRRAAAGAYVAAAVTLAVSLIILVATGR